ncbi:MAG: L-aspartate oxidase [Actinomycetota bacterium]|nr:L-aspartate oxidase [Actinomycetota bacterium]
MTGEGVDVLVLGSGVAGLTAARTAAEAGLSVTILTKGELAASATRYAQGGVAAALSPGDSPALHFSDTLSAGGGLCDPEAVRVLVGEGPDRLRELMALGASFDRTGAGGAGAPLALAREGGHSLARVVHAGGDATGHEVERALVAATAGHPGVTVHEGWLALSLHLEGGRVAGVWAAPPVPPGAGSLTAGSLTAGSLTAGSMAAAASCGDRVSAPADGPVLVRADHVVLACGGAGQLYSVTTNPALSTGDGVAMALAAGAAVADVEFIQFHPTALHHPAMPRPLLSEALRGEGALLRDENGVAFMAGDHPLADLAPRDVVSRAIARRLLERGLDHLWLDATSIEHFPTRFPTIWAHCRDAGLDPTRDWLPVAPAAHYLCGGVLTDVDGAATLPGLWACGEVACTGIHGANRLASNSLLEGLVFGHRVGAAIAAGRLGPGLTGAMRGFPLDDTPPPPAPPNRRSFSADSPVDERRLLGSSNRRSFSADSPVDERQLVAGLRDRLQRDMTAFAGVLRDGAGLAQAVQAVAGVDDALAAAQAGLGPAGDGAGGRDGRDPGAVRDTAELQTLLAVARVVVAAAAERLESRGCHYRLDHPEPRQPLERIVHFGPECRIRVPAVVAVSELER